MLSLLITIALVVVIAACYLFQLQRYLYSIFLRLPNAPLRVKREGQVVVSMSDGALLLADLYRPKKRGRFPAIVIRTAYGKRNSEHNYPLIASLLAGQGYLVVVQDVRGKYESEGSFAPFVNEERDGKETVAWAGELKGCDGNVACWGFSYLGTCAWLTAAAPPAPLRTVVAMFCCHNAYSGWVDKGVPYLKDILFWLSKHHGRRGRLVTHEEIDGIIFELPVLRFDKRLSDGIETFKTWMSHLTIDDYWRQFSVSHRRQEIAVPALFMSGWYDRFLNNTVNDFAKTVTLASGGAGESRMIIGPWGSEPARLFPHIHYGAKARFSRQIATMVSWLDFRLKGKEGAFDPLLPVDYFVMGKNKWCRSSSWPPPGVVEETFFLSRGADEKRLLVKAPPAERGSDSYVYDPENPTPSIGNRMLYGNNSDGPREQNELFRRHDLLVYRSQPFAAEMTITGSVKAVIFVSSSARDTDFIAKLSDCHPSGKCYFLVSGLVRMRFLDSVRATYGIEAGKIYRLEIDLGHTAHTFLRRHRLVLQIASSDFPNHERNLNTGGSNEGDIEELKATQTLFYGGSFASSLVLPLSPEQ